MRPIAIAVVLFGFLGSPGVAQEVTSPESAPATAEKEHPVRCDIKGNINSNGERIYHLPGGQYYDRTKIDQARGERWFCTEEKALAAGWRRSKR